MHKFYNNRAQTMNEMSDEMRGYLAGILDGEGCITIKKHPYTTKAGNKYHNYSLVIDVAQREIVVMKNLKKITGLGSIQFNRSQRMYNWHLTANQAIPLLKCILNLLVLKKRQAILGIEFHSRINKSSTGRKSLTTSELKLRKKYYDRMRTFKKQKL
jgi:hypothetical protein